MIAVIAVIFGILAIAIFPIVFVIFYMIGTIIGLLIRFTHWVMVSRHRAQAAGVPYEDEHAKPF